ncbi:MAG: ATP-binding cassette domain-containing protein [Candidatus Methylomirabilales bacterium]
MPAIVTENLVKRFGELTAVDGLNMEVLPGELFAFLGPNGAGKTTTIHMLCTLLRPTAGSARVAGHDCVKEAWAVRRTIGLVFQESTLDKDLTVYENLWFTCCLQNLPARLAKERIDEMLRLFELSDRQDQMTRQLSGGLRRRLDIARGVLHRPRILFLDEPTIGLDPQARRQIWQFLDTLRQREETTFFVTTHYLEEAETCDRVGIIDRGRLIALDTPDELKQVLKGDVVQVRSNQLSELARAIREQFHLSPQLTERGLLLEVMDGEAFLPQLFRSFGDQISGINIQRPSLNEVFLHLTGREFEP